jgi:hypothetical protein
MRMNLVAELAGRETEKEDGLFGKNLLQNSINDRLASIESVRTIGRKIKCFDKNSHFLVNNLLNGNGNKIFFWSV